MDLFGSPDPLRAERDLLVDYFRSFGEAPPFNQLG